MQLYFISQQNFLNFLKDLSSDFQVYVLKETKKLYPKRSYEILQSFGLQDEHSGENRKKNSPSAHLNEKALLWEGFSPEAPSNIVYEEYRATVPLKSFFFKAYEKVASYPKEADSTKKEKPYCIVGAKSCDLRSFITEDYVFLKGDYLDPNYSFYRDNNLIISSDCSDFKSVCYCLHLDIMPYPKKGFDLNLSQLDNALIIEVGSEKGRALIEKKSTLLQVASKEQIEKRDKKRQALIARLQKSIEDMKMPPAKIWSKLIREKHQSQVWNRETLSCVECAGCTQICPTCHCFLLGDQKAVFGYERFKIWDSCQYNGFARVAGGANPRPKRLERLRNRYIKKFDYFPTIMNEMACTGCGRCIEACPGKIDMRRIFRDLDKDKS